MVIHKRNIDYILLGAAIVISIIGLMMVYSASNVVALQEFNDSFYYFKRQLIFYAIGIIIAILIIKMNIFKIKKYVTYIFIACVVLLILVLIPGIGVVRGGARSWIGIGTFSIQPSEFVKIGLILIYAKYLSEHQNDLQKFKYFILLFCLTGAVFLLIMLEPDFGTGLVIVLGSLLMLYISGAKLSHFGVVIAVGVVLFVALIISAPYRLERITAFLNPWSDPLGSGFQGIQSLFAITPGGLFGHGYNMSMQKHFFLPEPQNDFIFAIFIEEFGLIGGVILVLLYFIVFYRGIKISQTVDDKFMRFLCLGITVSLFIQVFINISVVIGLLPVTGITLPLMSYGGSSLILSMLMISIVVSISKFQNYDYR